MNAELQCEGEAYYEQYYAAYAWLQNYFRMPRCQQASVNPDQVATEVAAEYSGIAGDIYTDIAKSDLVSGNNESPMDEHGNIHLITILGSTCITPTWEWAAWLPALAPTA